MEPRTMAVCHDIQKLVLASRPTLSIRSAVKQCTAGMTRRKFSIATSSSQQAWRIRENTRTNTHQHLVRHAATASSSPSPRTRPGAQTHAPNLHELHKRIQELSTTVLKTAGEAGNVELPSEQRVLYVLEQMQSLASSLLDERSPEAMLHQPKPTPAPPSQQQTATSALLGSVNTSTRPKHVTRPALLSLISDKAEQILRHPNVFITPGVLRAYVNLQTLLQQPSSFPDAFHLYARKPTPKSESANEVEYLPVAADKINAAIPADTANLALTAAIRAHNLPLAVDIITSSFCTAAFKRNKILRQAAVPIAGVVAAPAAAYMLSTSFSNMQQSMDPTLATQIAFAGIMAYVGAVGMVGYVAVTTANDQMDRVTWASGVPLWERWLREDERAAFDRVAAAWGFRDPEKRGEEEGEDWDSLREWVGLRGMILDRVSLMEGME